MFTKEVGKDVRSQIHSYLGPSCKVLTRNYEDCRPPFKFTNSSSGITRSCREDCFQHMSQWLTPLLENMPTTMVLSFTSSRPRMVLKLEEDRPVKFLVQKEGHGAKIDAAQHHYSLNAMKATGKTLNLLKDSNSGVSIWLPFEVPEKEMGHVKDELHSVEFPGNPGWSRFVKFVKYYAPSDTSMMNWQFYVPIFPSSTSL